MGKNDEYQVKTCMEYRVEGRIHVGRRIKTWLDNVEVGMEEPEIDREDIHNRYKWGRNVMKKKSSHIRKRTQNWLYILLNENFMSGWLDPPLKWMTETVTPLTSYAHMDATVTILYSDFLSRKAAIIATCVHLFSTDYKLLNMYIALKCDGYEKVWNYWKGIFFCWTSLWLIK